MKSSFNAKSLIGFAVIILFWELFVSAPIPKFSEVVVTFFQLLTNLSFIENIGISIKRLLIGWTLGALLGTVLGILIATNRTTKQIMMPLISAIFPIPKIALLPFIMVIMGLGEVSKITVIMIGSFFPSVITAYTAVLKTPHEYIEQAESLGLSGFQIIKGIIFPICLPSVIQGSRTSVNLSLTLLVAAEMLGAQEGLGFWILSSSGSMMFDQTLSGVICLSLLGIVLNILIDYTHKKMCPWDPAIYNKEKINVTSNF